MSAPTRTPVGRRPLARRPQQDRSRATQQRLLETAVECLAELGWSNTTVGVVAERAGVSRGAAQHHFPTREVLITAALDHMADARLAEFRREVAALPSGPDRTLAVLELVTGIYLGPLFRAALQLWVAASTDESLRARVIPLETRFAREVHGVTLELLGVEESRPGVREAVMATLDLARGLGLANVLTDDSRRRRAVLTHAAAVLNRTLGDPAEAFPPAPLPGIPTSQQTPAQPPPTAPEP
jgi:AcrR family transcriptional regulator